MDFEVTGQLLIILFALVKYLRKNENTIRQCFRYLQISRESLRLKEDEVLNNVLIDFSSPKKQIRLIKTVYMNVI